MNTTFSLAETVNPDAKMLDVTAPDLLEIDIREDGRVIWINVNGFCVFRACRIDGLLLSDRRQP